MCSGHHDFKSELYSQGLGNEGCVNLLFWWEAPPWRCSRRLLPARRDEGRRALLWSTFAPSDEVTQDFWGVGRTRFFQNSVYTPWPASTVTSGLFLAHPHHGFPLPKLTIFQPAGAFARLFSQLGMRSLNSALRNLATSALLPHRKGIAPSALPLATWSSCQSSHLP